MPRWDLSTDQSSQRDAALLSEVFDAVRALGSHDGQPDVAPLDEPSDRAELEELISAALLELHRVAPSARAETGIAPVLGAGVLQQLLRERRAPPAPAPGAVARRVDHRL